MKTTDKPMRDLEEYRKSWKHAKFDTTTLDADNRAMARRLATGKAMTTKQSLGRHYLFSFVVSLMLPVLAPMLIIIGFPIWVAVIYGIFGIIMAVLSGSFYTYIRHMDFYSLPTVEALKNAMTLSKRTALTNIAGFSMAFAVCCSMLWASLDGMHDQIFYGLVLGLVAGAPIGYLRFRNRNRLVKKLRDELKSIQDETL